MAGGHQAPAARPLGHDPGPQPPVDAPQPADPRAGRGRDLPRRTGARRARRPWRTRGWRAPTARSTRTCGRRRAGMQALFRQFSFPGGIPSHVAPETPGSIHEGGELGYVLSHAYGAAMDNPDLVVAAVVGDGEFETGPLAASWHANKFVDPVHDGAVLPILHLNGYKIANPAMPARIPRRRAREPAARLRPRGADRRGRRPDGRAPAARGGPGPRARPDPRDPARRPRGRRPRAAAVADDPAGHAQGLDRPGRGRRRAGRGHLARAPGAAGRHPRRTTSTGRCSRSGCGPTDPRSCSTTTAGWCRSCGRWRPTGTRRMSANPHANGGLLRRPLRAAGLPRARRRRGRARVPRCTSRRGCSASTSSTWCATTSTTSASSAPTRPPPTGSTRSTRSPTRSSPARSCDVDEHLAHSGRVVEMLSEHTCQGWLEGYLLTGRHGIFSCYEAFIHLVDSMLNQHAKWLKTTREHRVAAADRLAELPAHLARVAPGPQRLLAPGPRLHRPRGQQEGRGGPGLPAAGHQHAAVDDAALPGQRALRQRRGGRQAAVVRLAGRRGGRPALRPRPRHLGLGVDRRRRSRRRDRLRRRRADPRGAGRGGAAARAPARAAGAVRQRRRPDAAAGRARAPARAVGARLRHGLHHRQAGRSSPTTAIRG